MNKWRTLAFILIGIIIGYLIGRFELSFIKDSETSIISNSPQNTEQDANHTSVSVEPVTFAGPSADDDPYLGDPNAPITIIEFSDYECPFCKELYSTILPSLKKDFIDTGKVKYIFRDFPLQIHPKGYTAALAGECADDQNKFWEMHNMLFEKQSEWKESDEINWTLIGYAQELQLNVTEFTECLTSEKYKDEVLKDKEDGRSYGVKGTPTLFINGEILRAPKSYTKLQQILNNELSS